MHQLGLSPRQYSVLQLLLTGRSRREIAHILGLSTNSVKSYIGDIFFKTYTNNRLELFRYAWKHGLISKSTPPAETDRILTVHQRNVLTALWHYPNQELVGEHLHISRDTVNYHMLALYKKTGTHSTTELLRYAIEHGLIDPATTNAPNSVLVLTE